MDDIDCRGASEKELEALKKKRKKRKKKAKKAK